MKRRDYLATLSAGAATSLAGCSSIFGESDDPSRSELPFDFEEPTYLRVDDDLDIENFNFPFGYTQNGLESFTTALGPNSVYYSADSFKISMDTYTQTQFDSSESQLTQYVSDEQLRAIWEEQEPRLTRTDVFTEFARYVKEEEIGSDVVTEKVQGNYNKEEQYLSEIRKFVEGIDFELKGLVTEDVAYYTNSTPLDEVDSLDISNFTKGRIDLLVRENGLPYAIYSEIHEAQQSERILIEFSNFDNVYLGIPTWAKNAGETNNGQTEESSGGGNMGNES